MSCIYQVETDEFGTYDVLLDEAAGVRARLRRKGAELVSPRAAMRPGAGADFFIATTRRCRRSLAGETTRR
jgi:hypothetical protein